MSSANSICIVFRPTLVSRSMRPFSVSIRASHTRSLSLLRIGFLFIMLVLPSIFALIRGHRPCRSTLRSREKDRYHICHHRMLQNHVCQIVCFVYVIVIIVFAIWRIQRVKYIPATTACGRIYVFCYAQRLLYILSLRLASLTSASLGEATSPYFCICTSAALVDTPNFVLVFDTISL